MSKEDFQAKITLYQNIKLELEKVIESFSSTDLNDDLITAKSALSNYFFINDEDLYASKITMISDTINKCTVDLKDIVVKIDELCETLKKK